MTDGRKGQGGTVIFKIIALVVITILLVMDYAMLVVASRADDRAERMYREWKEKKEKDDE